MASTLKTQPFKISHPWRAISYIPTPVFGIPVFTMLSPCSYMNKKEKKPNWEIKILIYIYITFEKAIKNVHESFLSRVRSDSLPSSSQASWRAPEFAV